MKKIYLLLLTILAAVAYLRFVVGGNEDTWICENNEWVQHGNPTNAPPQEGCKQAILQEETPSPESSQSAQLANPASTYCIEQGGELRIEENTEGQYGICILKDGKKCEEWAFFRGECS